MVMVLAACAGVEGSERIARVAERLVEANGLSPAQGGPVTIVQGRLEQLPGLPVDKVALPLPWPGPARLHSSSFAGRPGLRARCDQPDCTPPDVTHCSCLQHVPVLL